MKIKETQLTSLNYEFCYEDETIFGFKVVNDKGRFVLVGEAERIEGRESRYTKEELKEIVKILTKLEDKK